MAEKMNIIGLIVLTLCFILQTVLTQPTLSINGNKKQDYVFSIKKSLKNLGINSFSASDNTAARKALKSSQLPPKVALKKSAVNAIMPDFKTNGNLQQQQQNFLQNTESWNQGPVTKSPQTDPPQSFNQISPFGSSNQNQWNSRTTSTSWGQPSSQSSQSKVGWLQKNSQLDMTFQQRTNQQGQNWPQDQGQGQNQIQFSGQGQGPAYEPQPWSSSNQQQNQPSFGQQQNEVFGQQQQQAKPTTGSYYRYTHNPTTQQPPTQNFQDPNNPQFNNQGPQMQSSFQQGPQDWQNQQQTQPQTQPSQAWQNGQQQGWQNGQGQAAMTQPPSQFGGQQGFQPQGMQNAANGQQGMQPPQPGMNGQQGMQPPQQGANAWPGQPQYSNWNAVQGQQQGMNGQPPQQGMQPPQQGMQPPQQGMQPPQPFMNGQQGMQPPQTSMNGPQGMQPPQPSMNGPQGMQPPQLPMNGAQGMQPPQSQMNGQQGMQQQAPYPSQGPGPNVWNQPNGQQNWQGQQGQQTWPNSPQQTQPSPPMNQPNSQPPMYPPQPNTLQQTWQGGSQQQPSTWVQPGSQMPPASPVPWGSSQAPQPPYGQPPPSQQGAWGNPPWQQSQQWGQPPQQQQPQWYPPYPNPPGYPPQPQTPPQPPKPAAKPAATAAEPATPPADPSAAAAKSTGTPCTSTMDCEVPGTCCVDTTSHAVRVVELYGTGKPNAGKGKGECKKYEPVNGQTCDQHCKCGKGWECLRFYVPDYAKADRLKASGKATTPAPMMEVEGPMPTKGPKPPSRCEMAHYVNEIRAAVRKCIGDQLCSGMVGA